MTDHMEHLSTVVNSDVEFLKEREKQYKGSWKQRGGVGAFMMLARKWDRIENILQEYNYNIFDGWLDNNANVIDDIQDLRRYLILVEAEMIARYRATIADAESRVSVTSSPAIEIEDPRGFDPVEDILKPPVEFEYLDEQGGTHTAPVAMWQNDAKKIVQNSRTKGWQVVGMTNTEQSGRVCVRRAVSD